MRPPTVQLYTPGECESIRCQVEISQIFWQNARVFLRRKYITLTCMSGNVQLRLTMILYIAHSPAPTKAGSFSLRAPSLRNAHQPHLACFLTKQGQIQSIYYNRFPSGYYTLFASSHDPRRYVLVSGQSTKANKCYTPSIRVMPSVSLSATPLNAKISFNSSIWRTGVNVTTWQKSV